MRRVLIHMGHVAPRQPGFESGTGTNGEIIAVSKIGRALDAKLKKDGRFAVTLCGGKVPSGWTGDVMLALHCDGSGTSEARGYCFGYPPEELGPKTRSLLVSLGAEYEKLAGHPRRRVDNYTADMRGYYGYHYVGAVGAKVLIEHGFLTNPAERAWINSHADAIAGAHYRALLGHFGLKQIVVPAVETKAHKLARLRALILAARAKGGTWAVIKASVNYKAWRALGGK